MAEQIDYTGQATPALKPQRPRPLNSLVASAKRITAKRLRVTEGNLGVQQSWQDEAWDLYDLVGEQHFLTGTLAARMGQARLFVGRRPKDDTEDVEPVTEGPAVDVLDAIRGETGTTELLTRAGVNLAVAGDGWIIGVPRDSALPEEEGESPVALQAQPFEIPAVPEGSTEDGSIELSDLTFRFYSVSEVKFDREGNVIINDGAPSESGGSPGRAFPIEKVFAVRCWKPHPRLHWEADSSTRASMPVLRELVGLTMHVGAQVDSRLAGAGVLLFPQEAVQALRAASASAAEDEQDEDAESDPVLDSLLVHMIEPIKDRDSASAVVPLVLKIPAEYIDKVKHIIFSTPLDGTAQSMREEAIRRLALGQDCPPELLLGVGSMNHWGAWLVKEDVVTTHLEPPLALVCDALTSQILWPVLEQGGMTTVAAREFVIWYDVDHLIMRPNRAADAKDLYTAGVISDKALRDANGFDETDAPEQVKKLDPAVQLAFDMVKSAPSLAQEPGLPVLVEQIRAVMSGTAPEETPAPAEPAGAEPETETEVDGPPSPDDSAGPADESETEPPAEPIAASIEISGPGLTDLGSEGPVIHFNAPPPSGEQVQRAIRHRVQHLDVRHGR